MFSVITRNLTVNSLLSYIEDEANLDYFKPNYRNKLEIELLNGYIVINVNENFSQYNLIVIDEDNKLIANKYFYYNQIKRLLTVLKIR